MIWWMRTHRLTVLAIAIAITAVVTWLLGTWGISFPALGGTTPFSSVPLSAIGPLIPAIALAYCLNTGATATYGASARRVLVGDSLLYAIVALTPVLIYISTATIGTPDATARNTVGYISLQLIAGRVIGYRLQALVPVLYLFAAAVFGRQPDNSIAFWAWPVAPSGDLGNWLLPVVFSVIAFITETRHTAMGLLTRMAD